MNGCCGVVDDVSKVAIKRATSLLFRETATAINPSTDRRGNNARESLQILLYEHERVNVFRKFGGSLLKGMSACLAIARHARSFSTNRKSYEAFAFFFQSRL